MSADQELIHLAHASAAKVLAEQSQTLELTLQQLLIRAWYAGYNAGFDHAAEIATGKAPA